MVGLRVHRRTLKVSCPSKLGLDSLVAISSGTDMTTFSEVAPSVGAEEGIANKLKGFRNEEDQQEEGVLGGEQTEGRTVNKVFYFKKYTV